MGKHSPGPMSGERGSVLLITILILFAVAVIGTTVSVIASMDLKISGNQRITTEAFTIAEAGLSEAIHRLSLRNPTTATIGGWTGNVAISDAMPYDPYWEARIYLTDPGSAPVGGGSIFNTGTIQDPNSEYLQYSAESGTENVLTIRHKWLDRDANGVRDPGEVVLYDSYQIPPENFVAGFPVEIITVSGRTGSAVRKIQAEVSRKTMSPQVRSALFCDRPLKISGGASFCGFNHDPNIPVETLPADCFNWHIQTGSLPGIRTTGDVVDTTGSSGIYGVPVATDSSATNQWMSLAEVLTVGDGELRELLANADNKSVVDPLDGITFIDGDADISSQTVGSGLVYVTGDCHLNGDLVFTGLIYIEGDLKINGGAWVLGSVVVSGQTDKQAGSGSAAILYSEDAVKNALSLSLPAIILSWREL